ncbi:MAG: SurA N-terminal domain-containing protein [Kiritimatiellia bacterium]|jgi:peptidyl-prolyl cis-trans isomerase D
MMFISKFNKLIRNRLVWSIIAVVIVIAFVGWGTQTSGRGGDQEKIGKLEDGVVKPEEFQVARLNAHLATSFMLGRPIPINPRTDLALNKLAWRRLAAVRRAQAAGYGVTDGEVAAEIHRQPHFHEGGKFNRNRYLAFLHNLPIGMSLTPQQFESYLKNEILLHKARQMMMPLVWVSPAEVRQLYHQVNDQVIIGYAILSQSNLNYTVEVTEEEARVYFDGHREEFRIPEKVRVKYAVIPITPAADSEFDEATLKSYYEENIEDFTVTDTNDWQTAEPFENVREQIRRTLIRQRAQDAAAERAADFEIALAPDRQGRAPEFDAAAAKAGLEVRMTDYFAADELLPEPAVGLEFNRAAFELRKTPDEYFSWPVPGVDAFYVLALDDRCDARLPEFDEVRPAVLEAARAQAAVDELRRLAGDVLEAARTACADGRSPAPVFAGYGLEFHVTDPFSLQVGFESVMEDAEEGFQAILGETLKCNPGELTDLVEIPDGYAIGFLQDREPASPFLSSFISSDLSDYIRRQRYELLFGEWQNYLVANAEIHNLISEAELAKSESEAYDYDSEEDSDAGE